MRSVFFVFVLFQCQETYPSSCLVAVFEILLFLLRSQIDSIRKKHFLRPFLFPCLSRVLVKYTDTPFDVGLVCGMPLTICSSGCATSITDIPFDTGLVFLWHAIDHLLFRLCHIHHRHTFWYRFSLFVACHWPFALQAVPHPSQTYLLM